MQCILVSSYMVWRFFFFFISIGSQNSYFRTKTLLEGMNECSTNMKMKSEVCVWLLSKTIKIEQFLNVKKNNKPIFRNDKSSTCKLLIKTRTRIEHLVIFNFLRECVGVIYIFNWVQLSIKRVDHVVCILNIPLLVVAVVYCIWTLDLLPMSKKTKYDMSKNKTKHNTNS